MQRGAPGLGLLRCCPSRAVDTAQWPECECSRQPASFIQGCGLCAGRGLSLRVLDDASPHLQIPVAVKSLRVGPEGPMGTELGDFLREVSVMMKLEHPHVLRLHGLVLGQPLQMVSRHRQRRA